MKTLLNLSYDSLRPIELMYVSICSSETKFSHCDTDSKNIQERVEITSPIKLYLIFDILDGKLLDERLQENWCFFYILALQ